MPIQDKLASEPHRLFHLPPQADGSSLQVDGQGRVHALVLELTRARRASMATVSTGYSALESQ